MKTLQVKDWSLNKLPIGFFKDKQIIRDFEFKMLTGAIRSKFMQKGTRENFSKLVDEICISCLSSLGGKEEIERKDVKNLPSKDREYIVFAVCVESMYEKELLIPHTCSNCKEALDVFLNPLELDVRILEENDTVEYEGFRALKLDLPMFPVIMKIPDGYTQEKLTPYLNHPDPFMLDYVILSDLVLSFDGKKGPFDIDFFKKQSVEVLDELSVGLTDWEAGLDFNLETECKECGQIDPLEVGIHNFLFSSRIKRLSKSLRKRFFT